MKHVPLIGNMSCEASNFGGGFGQLMNEEEGTECIIEEHHQGSNYHDDAPDDDLYHPTMCGQAFISKVMSHGSKKKKALRGFLSSANNSRRPIFYLRKNNTKNTLGYHETFSIEQPQDSMSESGTSHTSRSIDRSKLDSMDTQETTPPYIVQFDPKDLTLIQAEKEQGNLKAPQSNISTIKKHATPPNLHMKGKHGRKSSSSPFCPIALPTVTEEKSFDLQDDKSASSEPDAIPGNNQKDNLLPSVSSTSSSSGSSFFDRVNSIDEEESRDDDNMFHAKAACTKILGGATLERRNGSEEEEEEEEVLDVESLLRPTSPEMMQILTAMRQIIIKQQDAIQAISDENVQVRNQLALCQEDMHAIKTESAEQLIQITQLVIQKQGLEAETTRLKAELEGLRNEVSALKAQEDADLSHRFERLMDDDEEEEELNGNKSNVEPSEKESPKRSKSPNVTVNKIVDNESWRRIIRSFDSNSSVDGLQKSLSPSKRNMPRKESPSPNDTQRIHSRPVTTPTDEIEPTTVENSFSSSGSVMDLPVSTSSVGTTGSVPVDRGRSEDVFEFKNRLEEIQKKRQRRQMGPGRKSPSVRFA